MADTGYPGIPNTGVSNTFPNITGFPGIMVTPWTKTSPRVEITGFAKSSEPAEEPPMMQIMS